MSSRYCSRCGKAKKACICSAIEALDTKVELIILQHASEETRPLGTARILHLSLANSRILIGEDFTDCESLNQLLADPLYQHCILYPSDEAIELDSDNVWRDVNKPLRVILLDGTWKKAYKMWQLSSNLHHLPCIKLPSDLIGNYRIRKAPSTNSLSTVEAGYHLLQWLEPERDFSGLMRAFDAMIEFQIAQMPPEVFERNYLNGN